MTTLHDTEVDGVRCFWVDTGRPTLAASLLFRQGQCDEPLIESGWLHVLEHLALHSRGGGALHINGSVGLLRTSFDAHGPAAAVAEHLSDVTRWLSDPQFGDLAKELGVLRAESDKRGGPVTAAFAWRYGARGPGVSTYSEPGLGRATADALAQRARQVFTRGNAVLVLDGPPPADLTITLPEGDMVAARPAMPVEDYLPAAYIDESGVVLSGVVERSSEAVIVPELVQRALRDRLRNDHGAAYAPWSIYEGVDADHAVVMAGSDVNRELYPEIVATTIEITQRLREVGFPPDHVQETVASMLQTITDPYNAFGLAFRAAGAFFDGREPETLDQIVAKTGEVTSATLQAPALQFLDSLMMGIPGKASWKQQMPMISAPIYPTRNEGRRFRHRVWPATGYELRVGDNEVMIADEGKARSASASNVEAMFTYDGGRRHIVTSDGWSITVEPKEWNQGDQALALIDRMIPAERQLPQPGRESATLDPRMPASRRWWKGLQRAATAQRMRWVWIALLLLLLVGGIAVGKYFPALVAAVFGTRLILRLQKLKAAKAST